MSDLSRVDRLHSPARWRLTQKYLVGLPDDKPAFPFELYPRPAQHGAAADSLRSPLSFETLGPGNTEKRAR
jgi:hypothetical protein